MRPIGIPRVPTKREWFGRFVVGPGIVRRPISPHRRVVVADSPCRLTEQGFAVHAALQASFTNHTRSWRCCDEIHRQRNNSGGRFRFIYVTPKLRTASPAEADRSPLHEGPVTSVECKLSLRADGFTMALLMIQKEKRYGYQSCLIHRDRGTSLWRGSRITSRRCRRPAAGKRSPVLEK